MGNPLDPRAIEANDPASRAAASNSEFNRRLAALERQQAAGTGPPIGTIQGWAGAADPAGGIWLLCDGRSLLRTAYPALFTLIGTTYGSVDGTHFTLPDARGRVIIGTGTPTGAAGATAHARGTAGGEETHVQTVGELALHHHQQIDGSGPSTGLTLPQVVANLSIFGISTPTGDTGNSTPMNNLQPFLTANYIIRAL